ncbi:MAG: hypothetical protein ABH807_01140 [Candidatus Shapirobacteria bacterium]
MAKVKLLFLSLLVVILLSLICFIFRIRNQNNQERVALQQQVATWEKIAKSKPDYRDAWLQLAKFHYEQQNLNLAKYYVDNALKLDPNYEVAQEFKRRLP